MGSSIGWHVMQMDMHYWKICGSGGYVYHENICYGRTCPVGWHVLQICAEAATIEDAVSSGSWVIFFLQFFFLQFFSPVFFFFFFPLSETCFPSIFWFELFFLGM